MNNPFISFLMPAYNDAKHIRKALECILNQKTDQSFEIIVVDDGSRDQTYKIAKALAKKFPEKIKVFTKKNGGEASALNFGLPHCQGEFIAIVEADVELLPDWIKKILPAFKEKKVVGAGGYLITPKTDSWIARLAGYETEVKFSFKEEYPKHITSANAIYRRQTFEKIGRFKETLVNASLDSDFNTRLIAQGLKLRFIKKARALHHYKSTLASYLKRYYAYSLYRPRVKTNLLYSYDVYLSLGLFLTLFFVFSVLLVYFSVLPLIIFSILLFIWTLPVTFYLLFKKHDPVLFLLPPVMLIRNLVSLIGLCGGYLKKSSGK